MRTTHPSPLTVVIAFAAIYLIWGSTYLAIRFAIETLPPFSMAAVRFTVAGGILYAIARPRTERPTRLNWFSAGAVGTLLLAGGNGGVVWAEQWVPSGLAALIIATQYNCHCYYNHTDIEGYREECRKVGDPLPRNSDRLRCSPRLRLRCA